ncbi:hypothetical protein [Winogradskyella sp. R77965]|uniref:hypothetical protein n=1 Tax=Winogradskyella sp. R77965 TaxID=3093872 RepID=UPI0037DC2426
MKFTIYPIIYYSQKFIQNILYSLSKKYRINIISFFEFMEDKDYVIIKLDTNKTHSNFPSEYRVGTDVDIIVLDKDLSRIKSKILELNSNKKLRCIVIEDNQNIKIRYQFGQFLNFQYDLSTNTTSNLFNDCLINRKNLKNLKVPEMKYELLIRAKELRDKPKKKHHLEYLKKHKNQIDFDLLVDYDMDNDTIQKIKNS